jgi:hypothetical protein
LRTGTPKPRRPRENSYYIYIHNIYIYPPISRIPHICVKEGNITISSNTWQMHTNAVTLMLQ